MNSDTTFNSPNDIMDSISYASEKGKLIVFCGAGISIKAPSNLPSVDVIVCSVLENLIETIPELEDNILAGSYIFRNSPFELFMSVIQQGLLFRIFEVLEPLLGDKPNSVHHYLIKLLVTMKVKHIITTNFDDLLESALGDEINHINFYYSLQEVDEFKRKFSTPSIIKLHGSFFNKEGKEITKSTILTTTDSIYKSSVQSTLKKWAELFSGYTIVFLGYSGRDRLDVIPMLSYLRNSDIIWVCHNEENTISIPRSSDDILSKEVKLLIKGNHQIIPLICHTEYFLTVLGKYIGSQYESNNLRPTNSRRRSFPISVKNVGFLPPIFPKYSYLVAGYLLDWAGFSRQAGYAFSEFLRNCVDGEPRLLSNASNALGQVFERLNEFSNAETSYTIAMRRYWELRDYPSIIKTQCYFADLLIKMERYEEAERMLDDSLFLAERENYENGFALAYYTKAKLYENLNNLHEALSLYLQAIENAVNFGDFWVEAGSRQNFVNVKHKLVGKYENDSIDHILLAMEKIYWIGNGSAPSLKTASLVDPFFLADALIDSLVEVKGKDSLSFIDSNDTFSKISNQIPTDICTRVKQKIVK